MSDESKDTAATQTGAPQTDPPKPASNQPSSLGKIGNFIWDIIKKSAVFIWGIIKSSAVFVWDIIKESAVFIWGIIKSSAVFIWDIIKKSAVFIWGMIKKIFRYLWDIVKSFFFTIQALIFLIFKTPYILLPSATHTSIQDERYNRDMNDGIKATVRSLDLDETQKSIIIDNWLDQVSWTNDRSTRERDANEIIRWWQIILGVIIPVLANNDAEGNRLAISLAGIFVAVLTAVYQFRRPEERWRHYRLITERYLNEIWAFIALSGSTYEKFVANKDYKGAFPIFHDHMTQIRQEDITKFFGEVVRPANKAAGEQPEGALDKGIAAG